LTTPPADQTSPSIPLTDELRAAYKDLYTKYESAIESTTDVAILEALNASRLDVDDVLTKDTMYRLHANTELFAVLLKQINDTNEGLSTLKGQIAAVASHIALAGDIIAAINKVLSIVPGV
jgi:hypothetical protein